MKKTILAVLAMGALSCALFSQQAQATQVQGVINFNGVAQFNTHSPLTATAVDQWFTGVVGGIGQNPGFVNVSGPNTGDFVGLEGSMAAMAHPWTFGVTVGGPQPALWSVGGFTFDLLSSTVDFRSARGIIINGTGTVSGNGFDPTPMEWSFSSQNAGGHTHLAFSFSANAQSTPDGGAAVALLGIALTGVEVLRRKLRAG